MKLTMDEKFCVKQAVEFLRSTRQTCYKTGLQLRNGSWVELFKLGFNVPRCIDSKLNRSKCKCRSDYLLSVVLRIVYGNTIFHEIDYCQSCHIGTWFMGECNTCSSQEFPGIINTRTKYTCEYVHMRLIEREVTSFTSDRVIIKLLPLIISQTNTEALKRPVLEWVCDNWHHEKLEELNARRGIAMMTKMANRDISQNFTSEGQMLMAVKLAKTLAQEIERGVLVSNFIEEAS